MTIYKYLEEKYYHVETKTIRNRMKYLESFLSLKDGIIKNCEDPTLLILADLVFNYYDDSPLLGENINHDTAIHIMNKISHYDLEKSQKYIHDNFEDGHLYFFFEYFYRNEKWLDEDFYPNKETYYDTLEYLNEYSETFYLWITSRAYPEYKYNFDSDIRNFAQALYDRKKLPDKLKYSDINDGFRDIVKYIPPYNIDDIKKGIKKINEYES